tara:strand:+ start:155 stop:598 length:444 start_codon:yes stop_codon:yes gene_type:complete
MSKIKYILIIISLSCSDYSNDSYQKKENTSGDLVIYVTSDGGSGYNSTSSSNSDYYLSGNDKNGAVSGGDPDITFSVGDEIAFDISASGHPFYIKTEQGVGTQNQASNVINNGETNGTIRWTPSEAGTYYYQCSLHNNMYGIINIVQ